MLKMHRLFEAILDVALQKIDKVSPIKFNKITDFDCNRTGSAFILLND